MSCKIIRGNLTTHFVGLHKICNIIFVIMIPTIIIIILHNNVKLPVYCKGSVTYTEVDIFKFLGGILSQTGLFYPMAVVAVLVVPSFGYIMN